MDIRETVSYLGSDFNIVPLSIEGWMISACRLATAHADLKAANERLTLALRKANDGFEEHERKYYLELNKSESLADELAAERLWIAEGKKLHDVQKEQIAELKAENEQLKAVLDGVRNCSNCTYEDVDQRKLPCRECVAAEAAFTKWEPKG